jgi:required for meiotic nuclear division protein 1
VRAGRLGLAARTIPWSRTAIGSAGIERGALNDPTEPPPTVLTAEAYSYASRFPLKEARSCFPASAIFRADKTQLVVELGRDSVAYAFDFGALVLFNVPAAMKAAIVVAFGELLPREPHPPLREELLVEIRRHARVEVELAFDRVVVPELDGSTREVIATVLAQSVSIDYYDEDAQGILDRLAAMCNEVARRGRPPGRQHALTRFAGAAMAFQTEIIGAILLLDKPDLTWEDEHADRLHDRLRYHFEIPERFKALETKLSTIRETLQSLLEMGSERRMLFIEVAVMLLIVIEVVTELVHFH